MAKNDPGTKQTCPECGVKFYDLNKRPAVCPKCAHSFNPDAGAKTPKKREPEPEAAPAPETAKAEDENPATGEEEDIEGLDAEDEEAEALALDSDKPAILTGGEGDDDADPADAAATLPEGLTEEGVEDDADILVEDDEQIDLEDDLDETD